MSNDKKKKLTKLFQPYIDIDDIDEIFIHNKSKSKKHPSQSIIFLKKTEYDIFYSKLYRYPLLVKETITVNTGKTALNETAIDRRLIEDPFQEDIEIPEKYRLTVLDYEKYMAYGGSMGHNAPAGQHKTNMDIYRETFLLSNITPQDIVLNTGLWVLLENWCKNLSRHNKLTNITVFTGSIPAQNPTLVTKALNMNIPIKIFKIVVANHIDYPNNCYVDIFITNNGPYYVSPKTIKYSLLKYLVPVKSWSWFQNFTGINLQALLSFYGLSGYINIKPLRTIISTDFTLNDSLRLLMKKSNWFGKIVYSRDLEELNQVWDECQATNREEFGTLEFHEQYYNLVKQRMMKRRLTQSSLSRTVKRSLLFMDKLPIVNKDFNSKDNGNGNITSKKTKTAKTL